MGTIIAAIEAFCKEQGYKIDENGTYMMIRVESRPLTAVIRLCDYLNKHGYTPAENIIGDANLQMGSGTSGTIHLPSVIRPGKIRKECQECGYWTETDDLGYGTCKNSEASVYGCRTIGFHRCSD